MSIAISNGDVFAKLATLSQSAKERYRSIVDELARGLRDPSDDDLIVAAKVGRSEAELSADVAKRQSHLAALAERDALAERRQQLEILKLEAETAHAAVGEIEGRHKLELKAAIDAKDTAMNALRSFEIEIKDAENRIKIVLEETASSDIDAEILRLQRLLKTTPANRGGPPGGITGHRPILARIAELQRLKNEDGGFFFEADEACETDEEWVESFAV
jgi:hypothetical protein